MKQTPIEDELNRILAACDETEKAIFATFLLTGLREEELRYLACADVDLRDRDNATLRVGGEGKDVFSPKDYEERGGSERELSSLYPLTRSRASFLLPAGRFARQSLIARFRKFSAIRGSLG